MPNRLAGLSLDMRRAIAQLPEKQRECFLLVRVDGYTEEEASKKTGISQPTINRQVKKAEETLRNIFSRGE